MLRAVLFLCMAVTASVMGQLVRPGNCPVVKPQAKLDLNQYMRGTWYMVAHFPYWFQDPKCSRANYSIGPDGHFRFQGSKMVDGHKVAIDRDGFRPDDAKAEGQLKIKWEPGFPYVDHIVVHTDYNNYNLIWSCYQQPGYYLGFSFIMSRSKTLPDTTQVGLKSELAAYGIDTSFFQADDQNMPQCDL